MGILEVTSGTVPGTVREAVRRALCRANWPGISGVNLAVTSTGTCVENRYVIVTEIGNKVRRATCGSVVEVIRKRICGTIRGGTREAIRSATRAVSCGRESGRPSEGAVR